MKLPIDWLHEHCAPALDAPALAERLALTGTEVERISAHGVGDVAHFVVGRVLTCEQHPDADRLRVTTVDVGEDEPATIVCGAPNVAAGQTVGVARPGAVMPDGTKLGKAKLRGIVSAGMILAADEIGAGVDHAGIMVLDRIVPDGAQLAPGTPLAEVLPLRTDVLELEITPNRPDCLGVYGVAREVHAATGAPLGPPPWQEDAGSAGPLSGAEVVVECPDLCPRFTARIFEDVTVGPSPLWLQQRLLAAGQRPISNVVDITNYVMLLTGQPLHAFDLDRVAGQRLVVRRARDGEQVETLDGVVRTLDHEMVVIDDADGPTSIAAVMGGARSEVQDDTTRVLLEVATWIGPNVQRTSTKLGLRSEASGRFEKQLSPEATLEAQAVATRLLIELCGARVAPGTIDVGGAGPEPCTIRLREARVASLLGASIARERCAEILTGLGFDVAEVDGDEPGLDVTVPHFRRNDVTREADLIEEVARIDGVDRLPATLPPRSGRGELSRAQRLRRIAGDALCGAGLHEIAGWSFTSPDLHERLRLPAEDPRAAAVRIANPMSEAQSVLRPLLLGSLLDAARHNAGRGIADVRLWEEGSVYRLRGANGVTGDGAGAIGAPSGSDAAGAAARNGAPAGADAALPDERAHLGVLLAGAVRPSSWRDATPPRADVFAAKGVLERLLTVLRVPWSVEPTVEPFLHPGRSAAVLVGGERVGWLGELHPHVAAAWDLDGAAAFELELAPLLRAAPATLHYADLTSFPAVRQDLAIVVADDVPAARVLDVVHGAGGTLLAQARVFDVYHGEQVGEGRVSLALGLEFRAPDRTLTEAEVSERREAIAGALDAELGAMLRG